MWRMTSGKIWFGHWGAFTCLFTWDILFIWNLYSNKSFFSQLYSWENIYIYICVSSSCIMTARSWIPILGCSYHYLDRANNGTAVVQLRTNCRTVQPLMYRQAMLFVNGNGTRGNYKCARVRSCIPAHMRIHVPELPGIATRNLLQPEFVRLGLEYSRGGVSS